MYFLNLKYAKCLKHRHFKWWIAETDRQTRSQHKQMYESIKKGLCWWDVQQSFSVPDFYSRCHCGLWFIAEEKDERERFLPNKADVLYKPATLKNIPFSQLLRAFAWHVKNILRSSKCLTCSDPIFKSLPAFCTRWSKQEIILRVQESLEWFCLTLPPGRNILWRSLEIWCPYLPPIWLDPKQNNHSIKF